MVRGLGCYCSGGASREASSCGGKGLCLFASVRSVIEYTPLKVKMKSVCKDHILYRDFVPQITPTWPAVRSHSGHQSAPGQAQVTPLVRSHPHAAAAHWSGHTPGPARSQQVTAAALVRATRGARHGTGTGRPRVSHLGGVIRVDDPTEIRPRPTPGFLAKSLVPCFSPAFFSDR